MPICAAHIHFKGDFKLKMSQGQLCMQEKQCLHKPFAYYMGHAGAPEGTCKVLKKSLHQLHAVLNALSYIARQNHDLWFNMYQKNEIILYRG